MTGRDPEIPLTQNDQVSFGGFSIVSEKNNLYMGSEVVQCQTSLVRGVTGWPYFPILYDFNESARYVFMITTAHEQHITYVPRSYHCKLTLSSAFLFVYICGAIYRMSNMYRYLLYSYIAVISLCHS